MTDGTVELTIEVIGDAAAVTVSPVVVCVDLRGESAAVAAWAGRENSSIITKMPAAASAACIAPRATRRTIGCSMGSSTRRETGPLAYPRRRRQTSRTRTYCSVTTVQPHRQSDKGEASRKSRTEPPAPRQKSVVGSVTVGEWYPDFAPQPGDIVASEHWGERLRPHRPRPAAPPARHRAHRPGRPDRSRLRRGDRPLGA
jgi:hypothetical protein